MEAEGGGGGYRPHLDPRRVNIFNPVYASQNILDESILFAIMIKYFKLQKQQRINGSKKGFSFHFFFHLSQAKYSLGPPSPEFYWMHACQLRNCT